MTPLSYHSSNLALIAPETMRLQVLNTGMLMIIETYDSDVLTHIEPVFHFLSSENFRKLYILFWSFQDVKNSKLAYNGFPAGNYMFKVNKRNTRARGEICSKLTIKIPEGR